MFTPLQRQECPQNTLDTSQLIKSTIGGQDLGCMKSDVATQDLTAFLPN